MHLGGSELVLVVVWAVLLIVPVVAIVDVARHPPEAFERIGQSRTAWLVLLVLTAVFCGLIGTGVAAYELVAVRPKPVAS